jgi:hypothetical protein
MLYVDAGLFSGYSIGDVESISISHPQFADDTVIMGEKSWTNIRALKTNLILFEVISELKVDFNKTF